MKAARTKSAWTWGVALLALHLWGCARPALPAGTFEEVLAARRAEAERASAPLAARGEFALFLHANDQLTEAAAWYERLCAEDPRDGRWPYLLARIRQDEGRRDEAQRLLDEVTKRAPGYALVELRRAELWLKSGEPAEAEAAYRRYLARAPESAHGWLGLGRIALQRNAWHEAEEHLLAAIQADPTLGTSHALLAGVYEAQGDPARAARARAQAEASPRYREPDDRWLDAMLEACRDVEKLCVLADIALEADRVPRGIAWLRRALAIAPQHARARLALGKALLRAGDPVAGVAELRAAIRIEPELAEAHHALVAANLEAGDASAALAAASEAVARVPGHAGLHRQRGIALQKLGRGAEAEAALRQAVALDAGDVQNVEALGNLLWASGRHVDAASQFERARALSPLATKPRALLAGYYLEAGEMAAAEACLREIAAVDPHFEGLAELSALLHHRRGNALARAGDFAAAEAAFETALAARAEHEGAWTGLVAVWQRTGRSAEARRRLTALLEARPDAVFAYVLAAKIALQSGDRAAGLAYLERGLAAARAQSDHRGEAELTALRHRVR